MNTNLLKITGLVIGLCFVLTLLPQSAAAEVWSDDFETGLDGWTETQGGWTVENQVLESVYDGDIRTYSIIWHENNITTGTWSFDYQLFGVGSYVYTTILFMANGTDPPFDYYGYGLRIRDTSAVLVKSQGDYNRAYPVSEGVAYFDDACGTWTHYDITRDSTGTFYVYINATSTPFEPAITVVDTEYDYSERFVIYHRGHIDACIDNIVVDNEALITPLLTTETPTETPSETPTTTNGGTTPPPMDTTLLIAGAGVAGIVIIAGIVFLRRR
jgi:hypothetical protein